MKSEFLRVCLTCFVPLGLCGQTADEGGEVTATWNAENVLLASSQFTPGQPWAAQVMVFNTGRRYADSDYNHVWGTPLDDSEGRPWYAVDYQLTDGEQAWQLQTSPFSSDEVYQGQRSFRWITADITGDIYLRRSFTLSKPIAGDVFLTCGHDDAPSEFYINGVQVFTVSDGWNNDERTLLTAEQKALLKTDGSENVLALHVHQNWGGAFADCGLYEADMSRQVVLLPTLQHGAWPCLYYWLNYNDDIAVAEAAHWASTEEGEYDWIEGIGPFSNSNDQFRTTDWASQTRPLLVRRHFSLSAAQVETLAESTVELTCSYDENPKVYLNGTLIWSASGWNDNDYARYVLTARQKALLREGDNVLAVSVMQGGGGGHIDYGLALTSPYVPVVDGIGAIDKEQRTVDNGQCFDLSGRRLSSRFSPLTTHSSKGIYIVGGRKVVKGL